MGSPKIKTQGQSQGHVILGINVYIVNYIYKQTHIEKKFQKISTALQQRIFLLMKIHTEGPFVTTAHK